MRTTLSPEILAKRALATRKVLTGKQADVAREYGVKPCTVWYWVTSFVGEMLFERVRPDWGIQMSWSVLQFKMRMDDMNYDEFKRHCMRVALREWAKGLDTEPPPN